MGAKYFLQYVKKAEKSIILSAAGVFAVFIYTADANWTQAYRINSRNITALVANSDNIFAGTDGSCIYRSTDNGISWIEVKNGLPLNTTVNSLAMCDSDIYAGTETRGIYRSINNGSDWKSVNSSLTDTIIMSIAANDSIVFAGTRTGVFLSTKKDTTWKLANNGLSINSQITSFAINGNNIFAWSFGRGIFLSINNGANWVNKGLSANGSAAIAYLAASGGNIYAASAITPTDGGVKLSINNGTSWTTANNGLPESAEILCIEGSHSLIFTGTHRKSVYFSPDDGTSWKEIGNGLTDSTILSLAVSDSNIFAGTAGGGIWRRPLSDLVVSIKLQLKMSYDGNTWYHFACDSVAGAAWYDLYGDDVQFLRLSHRPSFSRDSIEIGRLIDTIARKTGKSMKRGDIVTYYLVARSSANQVLAVSNDIKEQYDYAVSVRTPKTIQKAPAIRISGQLIDCSSLKGTVQIALYSLSGEKLWAKNGVGIKTMMPNQLPRGVYTVKVNGSFGKASQVVIRE